MDLVFKCPNCEQELEVDASGAGTEIECPSCQQTITVPAPVPVPPPAPPKEEKHFAVPHHSTPTETLIKKAAPPLEVAAKESDKKLRVKTIKHGDCIEVGKDRFDDVLTEFLAKVGESNIVSITPVAYSHTDINTRQLCTDFAVMVVFKG